MKVKTLKSIYIYSTLVISLFIMTLMGALLNWSNKWYYYVVLYFFIRFIALFLYTYFSGVNISNLDFEINNNNNNQKFTIFFSIRKKIINLSGEFDNSIQIDEKRLKNIIYNQTTRKMLDPILKHGQITELEYSYREEELKVRFFES
jgi:hypothetical protein